MIVFGIVFLILSLMGCEENWIAGIIGICISIFIIIASLSRGV